MDSGKKRDKSATKHKSSSDSLDPELEKKKKKAIIKGHGIDNASTFEHPASFSASTKTLEKTSIRDFIQNCDIEILHLDEEEIVFDLIGVEPPLANALRRIMIAEIPTIAIEKVNMWQNTSIIPDENLAHRVGLIPLKVDARRFENVDRSAEIGEDSVHTEDNSIMFKLHVKCTKKDTSVPQAINRTHKEEEIYNHSNVYSGDMQFIPQGSQQQKFGIIRPIFEDILIAKLRPGQEIEMELICEKGVGKTHAKWSPVSTAFYRLVPDIVIKEQIKGEDAVELKNICPTGVYDIEDLGKHGKRAFVKDVRKCTTCRECIRPEKFRDRIELGKLKDRFEFHVESVGMYKPQDIVMEALNILKSKAHYWLDVLEKENEGDEEETGIAKK